MTNSLEPEDELPSVEAIAAMLDRMSRFHIAELARTDQAQAARRDEAQNDA